MEKLIQRKINFNAGPAALPEEVLEQAAQAVREYKRTGISILELPHRSKEFLAIVDECNALVKELCNLGDDHDVLWLQGGGRMQFCMIPMNFLSERNAAGYIDSGHWAEEALEYAMHYGDVQILSSSKDSNHSRLPDWPTDIPAQISYLHFTTNNTISGTQWHRIPKTDVPLIADMSSDILCCERDYSRYALFYAAVQKNLGTPGLALAVVRKDMQERIVRSLPPMLSYKAQVKENSILNTANVSGVYIALLMLRWAKKKGIAAIEKENRQKAKLLYDALDNSSIFKPHVTVKDHRSLMNVCFTADTPQDEKAFLAFCEEHNVTGIKGHRSVGGFRASIYNAVTLEDTALLADLMQEFEASKG